MKALTYGLNLHLAYLLFQEDSVSVRGLGTFHVRRYGAEIQLPAGLVLPPARRVSFIPTCDQTSMNLLEQLRSVEGLDADAAHSAVAQATSDYKRVLDQGDRLVLHGIGSLRSLDNQWTFKASLEANFLSGSYGLPMFRMDLIEAQAEGLSTAPVAPRVRSWQAAAVVAGALGLAAIGGTKDNVRLSVQQATLNWNVSEWISSQTSSFMKTWDSWGVTPNTASALANESVEIPESEGGNIQEPKSTETATDKIDERNPLDSDDALNVTSANAPAMPASNDSPELNASNAENSFALIVGAFAEKENAHRLAKSLQDSGYPAQVLDANVGLTKVALRTFASEDAARKAKAKLKVDFPAIWIYQQ